MRAFCALGEEPDLLQLTPELDVLLVVPDGRERLLANIAHRDVHRARIDHTVGIDANRRPGKEALVDIGVSIVVEPAVDLAHIQVRQESGGNTLSRGLAFDFAHLLEQPLRVDSLELLRDVLILAFGPAHGQQGIGLLGHLWGRVE